MTEMKLPITANDNHSPVSIAEEQATTQWWVFSILSWLSGLTKSVLEKLWILVDMRHPSVILEEKESLAKAMKVLNLGENRLNWANDNIKIGDEMTQEAA
jgi:hypothetical protein